MDLKSLRTAKSISQADFGKMLGVGQSTVAAWEAGNSCPRPDKLLKLEEVLGVPAGDIIRAINGTKI